MNTTRRAATLLAVAAAAWLAAGCSPSAAQNAAPAAAPAASATGPTAKAIFAGGCFWCVESDFDKVPGVISTTSGYAGGTKPNPTYEDHTGYAESVAVVFDPAKVTYQHLLDVYWHSIDPTTKDRQFCDVGPAYRTVIFTTTPEQAAAAKASKAEIEKTKPFKEPIVTQIVPATTFYPAEEYHQNYYLKNPLRYRYYRASCGRDARVKELWGDQAAKH